MTKGQRCGANGVGPTVWGLRRRAPVLRHIHPANGRARVEVDVQHTTPTVEAVEKCRGGTRLGRRHIRRRIRPTRPSTKNYPNKSLVGECTVVALSLTLLNYLQLTHTKTSTRSLPLSASLSPLFFFIFFFKQQIVHGKWLQSVQG